jgi:hypothetical protein
MPYGNSLRKLAPGRRMGTYMGTPLDSHHLPGIADIIEIIL